ncbi:MAG: SagB/ThcOx family dehydrogenase [Candidatus Cloacimonetes bacterium]|nr:SagB/ThcOx family dehydrogenase [Candidatus Cloacimonadota bacterium]
MKNDRGVLNSGEWTSFDFSQTDQNRGVNSPPVVKPYPEDAKVIDLPKPEDWAWEISTDFTRATLQRSSVRKYSDDELKLEELSYLLWSTQAIRLEINAATSKRFVPSAGSRHALETYLAVINVEGLEAGIYRYLPQEHALLYIHIPEDFPKLITASVKGQSWATKANVVFYWSAVPYRMEWRYAVASSKLILLDAGHVCQNLYLACNAVDCGTCAVAAYDQAAADELLQLDGEEEMVIYIAPVGKKEKKL